MLCDEQWPTDAADEVLRPARGSPEGGHPRCGGRYVARGRANGTHALTTRQVEQELETHHPALTQGCGRHSDSDSE
jgi:hypothetical protein